MNKKIIIIEGHLTSGKSTFALRLARAIQVPYLVKDTFKSALCANISINNREESSSFSAVTFDAMMYVVERLFETGCPVIIEGNFVPDGVKKTDESGVIRSLIDQYAYQSLTYKFKGNTRILYDRFIAREQSPERGQANTMFTPPTYDEFDGFCRNLDSFDVGGKRIVVDTTDFGRVDFESHIRTALLFMCKENGRQPG